VSGSDTISLDPLPDGFEVVADWGASTWPTRVLSVPGAGDSAIGVHTHASDDPELAFRLVATDLRPITVRGHAGYASNWRLLHTVVWQETPGHWVELVTADGRTTVDDLVAFAESLRVVSAEEWDRVVELPDDMAGTPATTAPALPGTVPPTTAPANTAPANTAPANTASRAAPPGTVLVANAAFIRGLAGQTTRTLELNGAQVTDPSDALLAAGGALARTRVFARSGALELGEWTATELGVADVEPIESLEGITIVSGFEGADVVVVLGLDRVPATAEVEQPIVFGDSVVLGAAGVLAERGYLVNAEVSRPLVALVADVEAVLGGGLDPGIVVLHLGTNGPIRRDDLERLLAATADVPNVVVINAHVDRDWIGPNNALLTEIDRPDDNIIMIDWATLATKCPGECFAADGIHLTEIGAEYFADRLADITGY
jgi:hypothetical protein